MLLASMMAATGTPYRRESISRVSPGAKTTGVPPSQVQTGAGGAFAKRTGDIAAGGLVGAHAAAAARCPLAVAGKVRQRSTVHAV